MSDETRTAQEQAEGSLCQDCDWPGVVDGLRTENAQLRVRVEELRAAIEEGAMGCCGEIKGEMNAEILLLRDQLSQAREALAGAAHTLEVMAVRMDVEWPAFGRTLREYAAGTRQTLAALDAGKDVDRG